MARALARLLREVGTAEPSRPQRVLEQIAAILLRRPPRGTRARTCLSMPSRDESGRRLSGAGQAKLKKQREAAGLVRRTPAVVEEAYPRHPALHDVPTPPPRGVAAVESWAAGLNLRAAVGLETADAEEAPRLAAVVGIGRELGRLKDKAARAEKALALRRIRLGGDDTVDLGSPPYGDPPAIVIYAFHKLASLAFDAATSPNWQPDGRIAAVKALASAGFLPCNSELQAISDAVEKQG